MWVGLSAGMSTPRIRGMACPLVLTLPLFMSRITANDVDTSPTPHQLAILADALDAGPNLHDGRISQSPKTPIWQTVNLAIEGKGNKGENCNRQEFCMLLSPRRRRPANKWGDEAFRL